MQQPEELWRSFPLDPAPSAAPAARQGTPEPNPEASPAPPPEATTIAAATATPAAAPPPPAAQAGAGELSAPAGQVGLFVVLVGVLVVLMARWLLNHTWRAAVTVAVMLLGVAALGVILVGWAADLGIVG